MCEEHRMTLTPSLSTPALTHPILTWLNDIPPTSTNSQLSPGPAATSPPFNSDLVAPDALNHAITHGTASLVTTTDKHTAPTQDSDITLNDSAVDSDVSS